jgi:hypothetical protein
MLIKINDEYNNETYDALLKSVIKIVSWSRWWTDTNDMIRLYVYDNKLFVIGYYSLNGVMVKEFIYMIDRVNRLMPSIASMSPTDGRVEDHKLNHVDFCLYDELMRNSKEVVRSNHGGPKIRKETI